MASVLGTPSGYVPLSDCYTSLLQELLSSAMLASLRLIVNVCVFGDSREGSLIATRGGRFIRLPHLIPSGESPNLFVKLLNRMELPFSFEWRETLHLVLVRGNPSIDL